MIAYPIARRVRAQVIREEAKAVCKFGPVNWKTFWSPVSEVVKPTTPARSEKIMK